MKRLLYHKAGRISSDFVHSHKTVFCGLLRKLLQTIKNQIPQSAAAQGLRTVLGKILHTQEVTGSSPVVSTKKFLISYEIRNFFFLFAVKKFA